MKPTPIVAGILSRGGALLITRRPEGAHLGGLWEFPGGKVEPGETDEQALVRELEEEVGVRVEVGEALHVVTHDYGDRLVRITFYICTAPADVLPSENGHLRYVRPAELVDAEMPAANAAVLRLLRDRDGADSGSD